MRIKTSKRSSKKTLLKEVIQNSLHFDYGGMMNSWSRSAYQYKIYRDCMVGVAIAYEGDEAIGAAFFLNELKYGYTVSVYVKEQHRRKKVGLKLLKRLQKHFPDHVIGEAYDKGIEKRPFFDHCFSNGIKQNG